MGRMLKIFDQNIIYCYETILSYLSIQSHNKRWQIEIQASKTLVLRIKKMGF